MTSLLDAFSNGSHAPRGESFAWPSALVWTHAIADALIVLACLVIPVALMIMVRRRNLVFRWAYWWFAAFVLMSGVTQAMAIWTLWQPVYGLEALVKVATAFVSVTAAVLLCALLPRVTALPSAERLKEANFRLAALVDERDAALADLRAEIEQRQAAETALLQSQKLEAVGQLTGGIAHDFNNLLQAVAGNLELIARKPDDPDKVVRWSGNALDAVERGRSLTGQLLAFSGKQRLDIMPVRLAELISGMRDLIERAVAPLSRVHIDPIDPTWNIAADPLQLELAILNLAFNARDAMPEGGVLTISARRLDDAVADLPPGEYVALSIADTGTGMTGEVRARATEPFFTTRDACERAGMGLSMAFGVVTQSGGALDIQSEPGKGAVVTLILRMAAGEPARDGEDDAGGDAPVDLKGRAVLLIDDDARVRGALAEMLRAAGARVSEYGEGQAGLAALAEHRPDLLIVDFAMPEMTGSEVVRRAREIDPALPVLVVTGFADSARLDPIAGPGVAILRKPFESHELLQRATELVRHPPQP